MFDAEGIRVNAGWLDDAMDAPSGTASSGGCPTRSRSCLDATFHAQLRGGRTAPSYERSTSTGVTCCCRAARGNLGFVRMLVEEQRNGQELGLQDLLLLNHLWMERTTTSAAAAKIIQQSQTEARRYLSRLVEHGLVESRGRGRAASYQLSSATYRRLGLEQQYVRQKGFEPSATGSARPSVPGCARPDRPSRRSRALQGSSEAGEPDPGSTDPSRRPGHARQEDRHVVRAAGGRRHKVMIPAP